MTPEEALNEKITKWCGFEFKWYEVTSPFITPFGSDKAICHSWFAPDSDEPLDEPPDFLDPIQGMGLLFKYVIPKLQPQIRRIILTTPSETTVTKGWIVDIEYKGYSWLEADESPTLALCRAVEKLIDEEDK